MSEIASETTAMLSASDARALRAAVETLEFPGLAARLADVVGMPIEILLNKLPDKASGMVETAVDVALRKALDGALATLNNGACTASPRAHKLAAAASGAVGGAAGFAGLVFELPITTSIIFRSIADIARAEGEDLSDPDTCLACLQVFALGSPTCDMDDGAESGYFATRVALAHAVREASKYLVRGVVTRDAPIIARLILALSARFGVVVSWKAAAQLVPVIGAIGGATVNTLFMDHFQNMAQGHFTVRRLERVYGRVRVRELFQAELMRLREPQVKPLHLTPPPAAAIDVEATTASPAATNGEDVTGGPPGSAAGAIPAALPPAGRAAVGTDTLPPNHD